jgi:hypothetical protein
MENIPTNVFLMDRRESRHQFCINLLFWIALMSSKPNALPPTPQLPLFPSCMTTQLYDNPGCLTQILPRKGDYDLSDLFNELLRLGLRELALENLDFNEWHEASLFFQGFPF